MYHLHDIYMQQFENQSIFKFLRLRQAPQFF